MAPRVAPWLFVALLVTTSGCAGLPDGGLDGVTGAPAAPSTTATPVPVPTDRPSLPPGVDDAGLADPAVLVAANRRALSTTPHRLDRTSQVADGTGTLVLDRVQRRSVDGRTLATLTVTGDGPVTPAVSARTRYRAADVVHERARLKNGRTVVSRVPATREPLVGGRLAERLLTAGRFDLAGRTDQGVVLRSREPLEIPGGLTPLATADVRVSVRVVVAPNGLVRSMTVDGVATTRAGRVPIRITQTVTPGPVTVERPAWGDPVQERDRERPDLHRVHGPTS